MKTVRKLMGLILMVLLAVVFGLAAGFGLAENPDDPGAVQTGEPEGVDEDDGEDGAGFVADGSDDDDSGGSDDDDSGGSDTDDE